MNYVRIFIFYYLRNIMANFFRLILLSLTLSLFLITHIACTQEKEDAALKLASSTKNGAGAMETKFSSTSEQSTSVKVFTISSVSNPVSGKPVDFTWEENGKTITFSEYTKNKVVLINFWGTWCPPCRKEIPDIITLYNDYKNKDLVVVGIALERDPSTAVQKVKDYAEKNGINYINFADTKQELAMAYGGIQAVPTTFIVDKYGSITETIVGMRDKSYFENSVKNAMK